MANVMTAGFVRDTATFALVVVGLDSGTFTPLAADTSLAADTELHTGGLAA